MKNWFVIADDWMVNQVEKFCHEFQRFTGRTNFWLYGKCSIVIAYCLLANLMAYLLGNHAHWLRILAPIFTGGGLDWAFVPLLIFFRMIDASWHWKHLEEKAFVRLSQSLANPEKISNFYMFWRLFAVFMSCVSPNLFIVIATISFQLTACDPLPPCEGKVKEWLRKIQHRMVPLPAESR